MLKVWHKSRGEKEREEEKRRAQTTVVAHLYCSRGFVLLLRRCARPVQRGPAVARLADRAPPKTETESEGSAGDEGRRESREHAEEGAGHSRPRRIFHSRERASETAIGDTQA